MPVEVRIDGRIETLAMANGRGRLALPSDASVTLDPHSKLLRRQPGIEAFQDFEKARKHRGN